MSKSFSVVFSAACRFLAEVAPNRSHDATPRRRAASAVRTAVFRRRRGTDAGYAKFDELRLS